MAPLADRPYQGERELERALDLLRASRAHTSKDREPTVRRLALLATSRLWEPNDAHIWEVDSPGNVSDRTLAGFALLWRHDKASPRLTLEQVTRSEDIADLLMRDMLDWALNRAAALATPLGVDVTLGVSTFADQPQFQAVLHHSGFVLEDGYNVYMTRALDQAGSAPHAPDNITIRPLLGEEEIERYNALYSFAPMIGAHRLELLGRPDYVHLVAADPSGDFIAFCECSVDREAWARGGRPTGWVEYIGVRQDLQGRGLGRRILAEGLRWLKSHGAQTAALITMGANMPAQRTYEAVGFTISERDYIYVRHIDSSAP